MRNDLAAKVNRFLESIEQDHTTDGVTSVGYKTYKEQFDRLAETDSSSSAVSIELLPRNLLGFA